MKRKRIKFSVVIALVITTLVFCLSACNVGDNEPPVGSLSNVGNESFKGQISEQSYESIDDAAKAFLKNELDGKTTQTNFVSYDKKQDVHQEELEKLPLGDTVKLSDITSAEMGIITYELNTVGGIVKTAEGEENTRTQTIYIILAGDAYYYFVPEARNGEMISQSYYRDFWNIEHYRNCSNKCVMSISVQIKQGKMSASAKIDITTEIKIGDHAIYVMKKTTVKSDGADAEIIAEALANQIGKDEESYGMERNGKMYVATLKDGQWITAPAIYNSVDEMFMEIFAKNNNQPSFLDYTYFVKTDNGFKLEPTKANIYAANYNPMFGQEELNMDINADYVVENEHMTSSTALLKASGKFQGVDVDMALLAESTYSDYGSTTVTIPEDLAAIIETLD